MKRKKFIIGGIIILIAIGSLGFMAFRGSATYYYTVSEVLGKGSSILNQNARVEGQVVPESVNKVTTANNMIKFILADDNNNSSQIPVLYQGTVPDTFKEGNDVVVEGHVNSTGTFEANQIIVKCPSKYAPTQPAQ